MKFGVLPSLVSLIKLMLYFSFLINIPERELNFNDFQKCMFRIGWRLDAYELISLKLGMMLSLWYD